MHTIYDTHIQINTQVTQSTQAHKIPQYTTHRPVGHIAPCAQTITHQCAPLLFSPCAQILDPRNTMLNTQPYTRKACGPCIALKTKCSQTFPCERCVRKGVECVAVVRKPRQRKSKPYPSLSVPHLSILLIFLFPLLSHPSISSLLLPFSSPGLFSFVTFCHSRHSLLFSWSCFPSLRANFFDLYLLWR